MIVPGTLHSHHGMLVLARSAHQGTATLAIMAATFAPADFALLCLLIALAAVAALGFAGLL